MNLLDILKSLFVTKIPENTGVILGQRETDYVVGVSSPIVYKERLKTGDWTPYAFDKERQSSNFVNNGVDINDSMACVSHSLVNSIESQIYFLTGKQINYSKRWLAKMSGTMLIGNYMYKVADAVRQYGLVLEEDYPAPEGNWTFKEYHKDIPEPLYSQLIEKGKKWLKDFDFQYEFLQITDPNIDFHLKHAPVQIIRANPNHAVCGIFSPGQLVNYLDSYPDFFRQVNYPDILAAMKGIVTPKTLDAGFVKWNDSPEVWFMAKLDSMDRLNKFKNTFNTFDSDYTIKEGITTLPTKKPF